MNHQNRMIFNDSPPLSTTSCMVDHYLDCPPRASQQLPAFMRIIISKLPMDLPPLSTSSWIKFQYIPMTDNACEPPIPYHNRVPLLLFPPAPVSARSAKQVHSPKKRNQAQTYLISLPNFLWVHYKYMQFHENYHHRVQKTHMYVCHNFLAPGPKKIQQIQKTCTGPKRMCQGPKKHPALASAYPTKFHYNITITTIHYLLVKFFL